MPRGVLAILGSGETAPGMTKVHRELLAPLSPLTAVNLDTSYGFQLNVPQMSEKLEEYFRISLNTALSTLHFPSYAKSSEVERTLFKQQVRQANYVFAGPGSPTYALGQWAPLEFQDDLLDVLDQGGTLCFASAAALTLGSFTAPIYEVYKVGVETFHWKEGLDVLRAFDLGCVVIPHFDNNEGGNYDTRYCYLGEKRLLELEEQLPDGVATLGVDEHTALILSLDDDAAYVTGRANCHWRLDGATKVLENGTTTPLSELRNRASQVTREQAQSPKHDLSAIDPLALAHLASNGGSDGVAALAQLVQLASTGGIGFIDPTSLIDAIIQTRLYARSNGQYETADRLRDALLNSGVDVHDTAESSTWSLRDRN